MTVWDDAARWYGLQEPAERASWRTALRLALPGEHDVVLDLACGPGTAVRELRRSGAAVPARWLGLDASAPMLAWACGTGQVVVRADVADLPVASGAVDLVLAGWLLHVLADVERAACLREVARVLRPGGRCVVVVPAAAATWAGCVVRTVATGLVGDSRALDVPPGLDEAVANAGLVVRGDVVTRRGYAARVLLLARP